MFKKMAPERQKWVSPNHEPSPGEDQISGWSINRKKQLHWRFMALGLTAFIVFWLFSRLSRWRFMMTDDDDVCVTNHMDWIMSHGFSKRYFHLHWVWGIADKLPGSGGHFGGRTGRYPSHHSGTGWLNGWNVLLLLGRFLNRWNYVELSNGPWLPGWVAKFFFEFGNKIVRKSLGKKHGCTMFKKYFIPMSVSCQRDVVSEGCHKLSSSNGPILFGMIWRYLKHVTSLETACFDTVLIDFGITLRW